MARGPTALNLYPHRIVDWTMQQGMRSWRGGRAALSYHSDQRNHHTRRPFLPLLQEQAAACSKRRPAGDRGSSATDSVFRSLKTGQTACVHAKHTACIHQGCQWLALTTGAVVPVLPAKA